MNCKKIQLLFFVFDSEGNPESTNKSWQIQSNAFDRPVRKTLLLSTAFLHLSIIKSRQCCALKPFLKLYWNFEKISK